ncbi:hypothetical protein C1645_823836 [Glomus cerebriforme]|uniref:Uncharacterized protein n=1 Tax=Glomus cerebriforme TaxID=658196 RepID=A0A397T1Z6_9GLOM|nr:hypothetical protein C1645_823836 [Glomus cerebriforme]
MPSYYKEESLWKDIRDEWDAGEYHGEQTYHITCKDPLNHGTPIVSGPNGGGKNDSLKEMTYQTPPNEEPINENPIIEELVDENPVVEGLIGGNPNNEELNEETNNNPIQLEVGDSIQVSIQNSHFVKTNNGLAIPYRGIDCTSESNIFMAHYGYMPNKRGHESLRRQYSIANWSLEFLKNLK